jgi:hypothetical protein
MAFCADYKLKQVLFDIFSHLLSSLPNSNFFLEMTINNSHHLAEKIIVKGLDMLVRREMLQVCKMVINLGKCFSKS